MILQKINQGNIPSNCTYKNKKQKEPWKWLKFLSGVV